jgi:hypothetical protein
MNNPSMFSRRFGRFAWLLGTALLLAGVAYSAYAADSLNLPVVKPVISCDQLAKVDLTQAVGAAVTIQAAVSDTPKGQFCKITGNIEPELGFEVDLPLDHWTQRFVHPGCGGDCGTVRATVPNANSCGPALSGEFAVAANDLGHTAGKSYPGGNWAADPRKRMDMAYRGNHLTTLAAKALMKAFYGQGPASPISWAAPTAAARRSWKHSVFPRTSMASRLVRQSPSSRYRIPWSRPGNQHPIRAPTEPKSCCGTASASCTMRL